MTIETRPKGDDTLQILLTTVNKLNTKLKAIEDTLKQVDDLLKIVEAGERNEDIKKSKRSISNSDLMGMFHTIMEGINKMNEK